MAQQRPYSPPSPRRWIFRKMAFGEEVFYDPFTYREYFKNVGRAYREQATTLIEICRLYIDSPQTQTYTNDDRLQK